jgi:type IV pilus assembly protein PilE
MMQNRQLGFTLIEAMIVLAVIAILASIAFPAYQHHVRKTRRVECEGVMMTFSTMLERQYAANSQYPQNTAGLASIAPSYPQSCPPDGKTVYRLAYEGSSSKQEFTLRATPEGTQTKDKCGVLTLRHTGEKGVSGASVRECW